jgi:flagellar hook-associated protein 3
MRVANKTIYDATRFELGNIIEDLYKASKVVTTGKRINNLSDDPVGLIQCLNIKSSLSNLDQLEKNISTARNWLNAGEIALDSINDLVSDTKVLCLQMANDSMNSTNRADAAELVDGTLRQILSLANTEVSGQYIFAGTKTDTRPFAFDDEANPTEVSYSGNNHPFAVKIGKDETVAVGRDGEEVFADSYVTIAESNNKIDFIEYSGGVPSDELTATVQSGIYSHDELAAAIENAMEAASSNGIQYVVTYDSTTKKFTIQDDGTTTGAHLKLLWATGTNADTSIAPDIGFNAVDVRDAIVSDNTVTSVDIQAGTNDTIEFREDVGEGLSATLSITIPVGTYGDNAALATLAGSIETAMDGESMANGNTIDYKVTYDAANDKFIIEEEGPGLQLKELRLLWNSGLGTTQGAATALGFDNTADDVYTPPTSDSKVEWGIFKTLIDLKDYLEANDVDGIQRSIAKLDFHFDNLNSTISDTGFKEIRLDIKEQVISDLNLSYMSRKSTLEDADIIEAITNLKAKEAAYQAALASSAMVMQLSLMDYL